MDQQRPRRGGGKEREFDLEERLLRFTCNIIDIVESLPNSRAGNHIGGQLIRCGTSPLANYAEAQSAESRSDFIHKLRVVLKELRETRVWLLVIDRKSLSSKPSLVKETLAECVELIAIFRSSIATADANRRKEKTEG